ncbi:MAG: ribulose-phosphate 3-epimerase, partial [Bacillota bacterium]|nr:ribulose-phosphate 3-epimerase [Bacillota bacterium]
MKVAPSILSADFANLERDVRLIEEAGATYAHIDVMDGHFVPNITIGAPVVKALRRVTKMPLDVHLMISEPERYIGDFIKAGADIITVHLESDGDVLKQIEMIKNGGALASVSIKPNTPEKELFRLLPILDMALIMTVEPGFGGQGLILETIEKIRKLKLEIDKNKYACLIEADGGITLDNAAG